MYRSNGIHGPLFESIDEMAAFIQQNYPNRSWQEKLLLTEEGIKESYSSSICVQESSVKSDVIEELIPVNPSGRKKKEIDSYKVGQLILHLDDLGIIKVGKVLETQPEAPFMLVQGFESDGGNKYRCTEYENFVSTNDADAVLPIPKSYISSSRNQITFIPSFCPFMFFKKHKPKSAIFPIIKPQEFMAEINSNTNSSSSISKGSKVRVIQNIEVDKDIHHEHVGKHGIVTEVFDGWVTVDFPDGNDIYIRQNSITLMENSLSVSSNVDTTLVESSRRKSIHSHLQGLEMQSKCAIEISGRPKGNAKGFIEMHQQGRRAAFLADPKNFKPFTGHIGVYTTETISKVNRYRAIVSDNKNRLYHVPGLFDSDIEAAMAHDEFILRNSMGHTCKLNFIHDSSSRFLFSEDNDIINKRQQKLATIVKQSKLFTYFANLKSNSTSETADFTADCNFSINDTTGTATSSSSSASLSLELSEVDLHAISEEAFCAVSKNLGSASSKESNNILSNLSFAREFIRDPFESVLPLDKTNEKKQQLLLPHGPEENHKPSLKILRKPKRTCRFS
jgi:hypothetical protein